MRFDTFSFFKGFGQWGCGSEGKTHRVYDE